MPSVCGAISSNGKWEKTWCSCCIRHVSQFKWTITCPHWFTLHGIVHRRRFIRENVCQFRYKWHLTRMHFSARTWSFTRSIYLNTVCGQQVFVWLQFSKNSTECYLKREKNYVHYIFECKSVSWRVSCGCNVPLCRWKRTSVYNLENYHKFPCGIACSVH